jgi:hypothetical protein
MRVHATGPGGVGQGYSEVAARCADDSAAGRQGAHEEIRAPALEAAERVSDLQLDEHLAPERSAQLLARELGAVQEDGIDNPRGLLNPAQVNIHQMMIR